MNLAATHDPSLTSIARASQSPSDADDFGRIVLPLRPELLRAAMRLTGRTGDAEDLVQDTLVRAYRSFGTFERGTNSRAWMHHMLKNTWINNHRAAQRRPTEVPIDEVGAEATSSSAASAEVSYLAGQPDSEVLSAMATLSDEFRMVVYLADVEGHPYAAVARMMGTPLGTVMSRLHRARRQLRAQLGDTARRRRLVRAA